MDILVNVNGLKTHTEFASKPPQTSLRDIETLIREKLLQTITYCDVNCSKRKTKNARKRL
jgi:hypothetical protein